jgi:HEAT repeat protein
MLGVMALGRLGPAAAPAAEDLGKLLEDEDKGVRNAAAEAIEKTRKG